MTNVNGLNLGSYSSLNDYDEIIIKRVNDNKWKITAKKNVTNEKVNTINFTTNNVEHFSLEFSNSQNDIEPDDVGFDYK